MANFLFWLKVFTFKTLTRIILISSETPDFWEKVSYFAKALLTSSVVVYVLDALGLWFDDNHRFVVFVLITVLVNMLFGMYLHHRKGTFSWKEVLWKTNEMILLILITYLILEMILITAGDGQGVNVLRIALQVGTLLYPGSKVLKNVFIRSKGKYPPEWLMKRLYNFEKNGDLKALFEALKKEEENGENI